MDKQRNIDIKDSVLKLAMKDTARNSQFALPLIILFEVFMIVSWILNVSNKGTIKSLGYLFLYVALLVISVAAFFFLRLAKRRLEKTYRRIDFVQHAYAFVILAWATVFTFIGSTYRDSFDYLIFITIVTIVPLFCFLRPWFWIIVQLIGTACMFYLASFHDHYFAFLVNFSVFTIISMLAGWTIHHERKMMYLKQIALEQEKNYAYDLAHKDTLTGFANRQSYIEELDRLTLSNLPDNLIVAAFDVDGLKSVNDSQGHEAGDELLNGAAECLKQAFSRFGVIYRVGGDEFTGILYASDKQLEEAIAQFKKISSAWHGTKVKHLSVSAGVASVRSNAADSLASLVTKADNAMYENKRLYYQTKE